MLAEQTSSSREVAHSRSCGQSKLTVLRHIRLVVADAVVVCSCCRHRGQYQPVGQTYCVVVVVVVVVVSRNNVRGCRRRPTTKTFRLLLSQRRNVVVVVVVVVEVGDASRNHVRGTIVASHGDLPFLNAS
jgi:hypothetical protein